MEIDLRVGDGRHGRQLGPCTRGIDLFDAASGCIGEASSLDFRDDLHVCCGAIFFPIATPGGG